jgi:hypothetical protein
VIKLPLGVHSKTGRRCELLDASGQPLEDPFEALRSLPRVAREVIDGWLEQGRRARLDAARPRDVGGAAARLVEQCHVLGALKKRAEETFYLTHVERQVLLCTLGHLGSEGSEAIHAVISRCHNYRAEVTDRQIRKMPDAPISCPRIRERLPQITAAVGCSCHFNLRSGGYPTPVLHVRKPSQISAFTARRGRPPGAAADTPRPSGGQAPGEPLVEAAEQRIRKIAEMKRHIKGIESSITRLSQELATLFDEAGVDELLLPLGTLRRTRRDGPAEGWDFRIEV